MWDHSDFRSDMLGRLRRTAQFISVTSFGPAAERLIARVRHIHLQVQGVNPSGAAYRASDPDLLTWVHVAESRSFLAAHLRFRNPRLSGAEQDDYYRLPLPEGLIEHEFGHVFFGITARTPAPDPAEAMAWRWQTLPSVAAQLDREPASFTPWFRLTMDRIPEYHVAFMRARPVG